MPTLPINTRGGGNDDSASSRDLAAGSSAPPTQAETIGQAQATDLPATLAPTARADAAASTYSGAQPTAQAVDLVPGYEILGELGRGGMGVVYKARHLGLNRLVALKMILSGGHAGSTDRERFRTEAEAIARLQHANIVQVHDFGEHEGTPFFSLEFCPGGSLDRKLKGMPLPPMEAANLVQLLARAMQAAHEKNVIHRDLKPANILLTEDGQPKITDFGLAKKIDQAGHTVSGAIMGTPSYMAPEQAGATTKELGPACDVYALGAILYELLTGRAPFKAATPLETMRQAAMEEPVPPGQLQSKTPKDLETICLKCLSKEPALRYATALELAEDLKRFQSGIPVRARPVGRLGRLRRWCRRNPALAAALGAVAASLIVGTIVAITLAVRANEAMREAELRAEKEALARKNTEIEKDRADRNLRRAQKAVEDYFTNVAEDDRLKQQDLHALRKKLLESAIPYYEEFARQKTDEPALLADKGRAQRRLALVRKELGELPQALSDANAALAVFAALVASHPDNHEHKAQLGISHQIKGRILSDASDVAGALAEYRAAIDLLAPLAQSYPSVSSYTLELAKAHNNTGTVLRLIAGQRQDACGAFQQAIDLYARLVAQHPANPEYKHLLSMSRINLGSILAALRSFSKAKMELGKAIEVLDRLAAEYPSHVDYRNTTAHCYFALGQCLARESQRTEADTAFSKAIRFQKRLIAEFPSVPVYRHALGEILSERAIVRVERDLRKEARADWLQALGLYERLALDFPGNPEYSRALALESGNFGEMLSDEGRLEESLPWLDKAVSYSQAELAKGSKLWRVHAGFLEFGSAKALALARLGRRAEAAATLTPLVDDKALARDALFNTACALALCSAGNKTDVKENRQYSDQAVRLLRRAHQGGYFRDPVQLERLRTSADLNTLRSRDDFKKVVEEAQIPKKRG